MRKTFSITAVGYSSLLPLLVEAGSFKWNTNTGSEWAPAGETPAAGFHQPLHPDPASAQPPAPTSPPDLRKKEERLLLAAAKRSTTAEAASICGYEDGQAGTSSAARRTKKLFGKGSKDYASEFLVW